MACKGQEKLLPVKPEQAAERAVATPEDTRHLGAPAAALIDRGHEHARHRHAAGTKPQRRLAAGVHWRTRTPGTR